MKTKNKKEVKMSKKHILLLLMFLLVSSTLLSHPMFYGTEGLYHTYSAKPTEMGYLTFGLHGNYAYADEANSDSVRHFGNINTFLGYAPFNYFELALNTHVQMRSYIRTNTGDVYNFAFKSLRPVVKIGFTVFKDPANQVGFNLGTVGFVNIPWEPTATSDSEMVDKGYIGSIPRNPNFGGLFLVDMEFNVMKIHVNVGYEKAASFKNPNDIPSYIANTFEPPEPDNLFIWGASLEILTAPGMKLLFETVGKHSEIADTMWITPGIRFITPGGVTIDLGGDYAMYSDMDFVPDYDSTNHAFINSKSRWRAWLGITTTTAIFAKPPPPPKATIAGKVSDKETGEALSATISFPGSDLKSITSDPETGLYKIEVTPGLYRFHVSAEGYRWIETPIRVVKGQTEVKDFTLKKKPEPEEKKGILTGKVASAKEKKPIAANITIVEINKKTVADASTGVYRMELPPGTYTVKAEADKYVIDAKPGVVVNDKETTIQNFELSEKIVKGQVITLRGIYFDSGKATIRPESYPVLDDALRVLQANPNVIVEIAGHTDSVGGDAYNLRLSDARANSVRTYLITRGIAASRLIARGYGETMPIASNGTRDGRQMNRRIEFRVLSD